MENKFLKVDKEKIKVILLTSTFDLTLEEYRILSQAFRKGYVTFEMFRKYNLARFGILENKKELLQLQEYEKEVNNNKNLDLKQTINYFINSVEVTESEQEILLNSFVLVQEISEKFRTQKSNDDIYEILFKEINLFENILKLTIIKKMDVYTKFTKEIETRISSEKPFFKYYSIVCPEPQDLEKCKQGLTYQQALDMISYYMFRNQQNQQDLIDEIIFNLYSYLSKIFPSENLEDTYNLLAKLLVEFYYLFILTVLILYPNIELTKYNDLNNLIFKYLKDCRQTYYIHTVLLILKQYKNGELNKELEL